MEETPVSYEDAVRKNQSRILFVGGRK